MSGGIPSTGPGCEEPDFSMRGSGRVVEGGPIDPFPGEAQARPSWTFWTSEGRQRTAMSRRFQRPPFCVRATRGRSHIYTGFLLIFNSSFYRPTTPPPPPPGNFLEFHFMDNFSNCQG